MIYKFRMISGDNKAFLRDYEIDSNQTFLMFHQLIQKNLKFDSSLMASFFLADECWNKGLELTLIDMENEGELATIPMDSVKIEDIIKERKARLLYVYDILNDNLFFIELMDIHPSDCAVKYPRCSASIGEPPLQSEFMNASMLPISDENITDEVSDEFDSDDMDYGAVTFDKDDE